MKSVIRAITFTFLLSVFCPSIFAFTYDDEKDGGALDIGTLSISIDYDIIQVVDFYGNTVIETSPADDRSLEALPAGKYTINYLDENDNIVDTFEYTK